MGYFGPLGIPWTCTLGDDPTIKTICRIKKTGKTYPIIPTDRWSKPEIISAGWRLGWDGPKQKKIQTDVSTNAMRPWINEPWTGLKEKVSTLGPCIIKPKPPWTIDIFPSMDSIGLFIPLTKWSGFYFPRVFLAFSAQLFQQHRAL